MDTAELTYLPRTEADRTQALFDQWKVCVLVPTYNNATTLAKLLEGIRKYTSHVLVVNDGSTDDTGKVLRDFTWVHLLQFTRNQGKGMALRKGFERALALGYDFAISIDADGQHYPQDLPVFLEFLDRSGSALLVGQRNMDQESVPGRSSFGNRFSSFWFTVETGIRLKDTQSGYRLYPLVPLSRIRFFTRKYEFEIEVMVRAAWRGIPVQGVPVSVYYPPANERVSHFRPFRDFTRISILNTFLCIGAFFFYWPFVLLRRIFPRRWVDAIRNALMNEEETGQTKILSVAFGLFMGIVPIWGFQLAAAIFGAFLFRLNKILVILFANISIPPMIPLILYLSFRAGAVWMPGGGHQLDFSGSITLDDVAVNMKQYLYGSFTLAFIFALAGALVTMVFIKLADRKKKSDACT